ncbi:MAG: hypothetical protein WC523_06345 [Patescibacteria group bacterium]|jgi:hypothetical protein
MKIKFNKKQSLVFVAIFSFSALFLFIQPAHAAWEWAIDLFGGICMGIVSALGWILMKLMGVLIYIAQYNNFLASGAVANGWVMVRDVCNMLFVLILLVIAFATILRIESYSYKKWLPKLILMAVLINFSKTICGLLIDAAQIVMLTFVNAFKDIGGANLTDILGIKDWQSLEGFPEINKWEVAAAYALAVIYVVISIIVIAAMIAMLVMRIVMIWIYVVLSPLAYLLSAFPGGQKYASEWWSEFIKNLIVGPVLAFFIWLSFTSLANFNSSSLGIDQTSLDQNSKESSVNCQANETTGACQFGTSELLIKFIIAIGMLLGGMKITQDIGGVAGKAAGSVASKGKKLAIAGAAGAGLWAARGIGRTAKHKLGDARDWLSDKAGVDLNVVAGYKRYQEQVAHNREVRRNKIRKNTLTKAEKGKTWIGRKLALASTGDVAWQNILDKKHRVLTAGSPETMAKATAGIKKQKETKEYSQEKIDELKKDSANIVTDDERNINTERARVLFAAEQNYTKQKEDVETDPKYRELLEKEQYGTITKTEENELTGMRKTISDADSKIAANKSERQELDEKIKNAKVVDKYTKEEMIKENETKIAGHQNTINEADKEIKKFNDVLRKNKLSEVQSAKASINAKMEAEASKDIANFSNPDQLVAIYREAEEQGDEGLMAAAYKKLAKTGNYNELNKELGVGTGWEGMQAMVARMQTKEGGGMTEQDARALVAEVGELCKSVGHYEAFGTQTMNAAGQWEETNEDQFEANLFSEKAKMQVQQFVRTINRLGQGAYQTGKPHTAENWDMSRNQISLYAAKDHSFAGEIEKTGNVSAIQFIGANPENIKRLRDNGANEVADVIESLCKKAKGMSVANPLETIRKVSKA